MVVDCESGDDEQEIARADWQPPFTWRRRSNGRGDRHLLLSETLLAMVNAMHPISQQVDSKVVQILGGIGNPSAEVHANHLTTP